MAMANGSQSNSSLFEDGSLLDSSVRGTGLQADQARIFRAIGQDLEAKAIATFCLRLAEGRYLVRGLVEMGKESRRANSLWAAFRKKPACADALELSYSAEEIELLDTLGRARRASGNKLPDFLSVSQQLRAVAALIERKGGEITRVDRIAYAGMIPAVAIHYKTFSGGDAAEEHTASNLYDYCVHMYKTRKAQSIAAAVFRAA
jgi:hypothetical protein